MKKTLLALAAAFMLAAPAVAEENQIEFSYSPDQSTLYDWGKDIVGTYDVAIKIKNPAFEGYKITGLYVPMNCYPSYVRNLKGWLSSELKLNGYDNAPDIVVKEATLSDKVLSVTFDEPYIIPAGGVYAGYSFTVTNSSVAGDTYRPVRFTSPNDENDGFYAHTDNENKWVNVWDEYRGGAASAIVVRLSGEFHSDGCKPTLESDYYFAAGKDTEIEVAFENDGTNILRNIEYSLSVDGRVETGSLTFELPIAPMIGAKVTKKIAIDAIETPGVYNATFEVTKANGKENGSVDRCGATSFHVVPFIPVNRPLVEEFTGLWCANCPRGYVALETFNEEYGDLFTAASYHGSDAMTVTNSYPGPINAFPTTWFNRTGAFCDPINMSVDWPAARKGIPNVEIEADLYWKDEDKTQVEATAKFRFVEDMTDANYKIGYLLLGDDMQDDSWVQSNTYSGTPDTTLSGKWWDLFTKGGQYVKGLIYNDVVLGYEYALGVENSVPSEIKGSEFMQHSCVYSVGPISNYQGKNIPYKKDKVRVLAFVIDDKGVVLNTISTDYPTENVGGGVDTISDAAVVAVKYYDVAGSIVTNPERGIYIKVETLADGTVRTSKVVK